MYPSNLKLVQHGAPLFRRRLKRFIRKLIKKVLLLGIIAVFAFGLYVLGASLWYTKLLPDPNKVLERDVSESTKIYDRKGEVVLYDVHGEEQRTVVQLDQIPDIVRWAALSAEDKDFYKHHGVKFTGMIRAAIINTLKGYKAQGGSTITQQFVKNAILSSEKTYTRKLKEVILAYQIEKKFTKDQILQMYLNEIPYGSVIYGIQSASQAYFKKDVKDINLKEAAILASIPKATTYYSPYGSHVSELLARADYVLDLMAENGYITQEATDIAKKEDVKFALKSQSIIAPHFVMYVKDLLSKELGEDLLERGGLKVITTIDLDKQKIAEAAVVAGVEKRGKQYNFKNAALVSLDPKTGQILAMVGAKDYFDMENDGNVNVTLSLRQPGSSIKPFIYLAAFLKGYTPNTVLYDADTVFKTEIKDYHPLNYDGKDHGPVTMRSALAGSLNIPAVKTIYLVGVQKVIDLLELFGYTSFEDRSRFGLSLVLGGGEVRLLEHAAAYAILANSGVYRPQVAILQVLDRNGNVLMEYENNERVVAEKNYANMVTDILSDNNSRAFIFGAQNNLILPDRPVAAKTGTTNDYHDAWTMGYTPSLVAGVWVGNNDNSEMKRGADGSIIAAPIWNEYMKKALDKTPAETFEKPEIPLLGKPVLDGDISLERVVKIDKYSKKLATALTPESFTEEKKFAEAHNILHYIDKDDPQGSAPADPESADASYGNWEEGVQKWAKKKFGDNFVNETSPIEYDDVHVEQNRPVIFIKGPGDNSVINDRVLNAEVSTSAPRGISRVEYYLDNNIIGKSYSYPYGLSYSLSSYFVKGFHRLRAIAYDDIDNSNEASIELNIMVDIRQPEVIWQIPNNNSVFRVSDFPIGIRVSLTDLLAANKVNFFYRNKSKGQINNFASVIFPETDDLLVQLNKLFELGDYELFAEMIDKNGNTYKSPTVDISVR